MRRFSDLEHKFPPLFPIQCVSDTIRKLRLIAYQIESIHLVGECPIPLALSILPSMKSDSIVSDFVV